MLEPELATGREAPGVFLWFILLKFSFSLHFDGHNLKMPVPAKRHPGRDPQEPFGLGSAGFTSYSIHRDVCRKGWVYFNFVLFPSPPTL